MSECDKCGQEVKEMKRNEKRFKIANIVRLYSGWDIGESDCFRIADELLKDFEIQPKESKDVDK